MISICIPIYNTEVTTLVTDLKSEIKTNHLNAEIVLIDDASDEYCRKLNKPLETVVDTMVWLPKNVGRARIRNLFLKYAKGQYLLFLDSDGEIISNQFIQNYQKFITENKDAKVVYGGRHTQKEEPSVEIYLRWKFANERESLPLFQREKNRYLSFQTNNFLIERETFSQCLFDEQLTGYGYEDLVFAKDLKDKGIDVFHINNPILNVDLETNDVYLKKVEDSINNLCLLLKNSPEKVENIKLVKAYHVVKKLKLSFVLSRLFSSFGKEFLREKLLGGKVSLRYLDMYKLGLLLEKTNPSV
ncbi:glycosyltransferase family 2 protein [Riemerella anatipestifer]|uniref:glycosyltransferase family 2 protein n=1 Tax=Riemerella anatipestifer TaxID=34085 RepID=UPI0007ECE152|nr:glycosyltransferase family 2 protein [Riemerella anatipestifer]MBT0526477.1 glycosyltransferase family 2 protein [Riemerella anatipestifer]MBT0528523.1 glycosyltransferase family 2 protein [Riemerella anatipestifer]MBT0530375.1 glycosyltransferase family 2 protein [Riemerella anatipestifer]MBT0532301.1 glycosyltransferase family 2 protein [Riemerella anatipestifer]MBT0536396.1 glycosyltransferase family 2 protein [Riemerella anatipestifer]